MADPLFRLQQLPIVRGRYTENASLGGVSWFRTGGSAEVLFKPADRQDLIDFLVTCPSHIPVTVLGVMSNVIVRDGGIKGVVIRLGRDFAEIEAEGDMVRAGAAALDVNIATTAARHGIGGLEFLCGVPGTLGGALRMNAGAYGSETKDVLIEAEAVDRQGVVHKLTPDQMGMRYRHTETPTDYIFLSALLAGTPEQASLIEHRMGEIKDRRASTQPIKSQTGGSTFANPLPSELIEAHQQPDLKAWQLIDQAGCRGLMVGGAQMSEKHCNFMINTGTATAFDLETLGEEVRRRVREKFGVTLRWEIKRLGEASATLRTMQ